MNDCKLGVLIVLAIANFTLVDVAVGQHFDIFLAPHRGNADRRRRR